MHIELFLLFKIQIVQMEQKKNYLASPIRISTAKAINWKYLYDSIMIFNIINN